MKQLKLNITHLGKYYPPERGGIETALKFLAEAGTALGHNVECIVSQHNKYTYIREEINHVLIHRLSSFGNILSTPITPSYFLNQLSHTDLLHLHLPNPIAEFHTLLKIKKQKKLNPQFNFVPFLHALPLTQGKIGEIWFSKITTKLLNIANALMISNDYLLKTFPVLNQWKNKIEVIPFATDCYSHSELSYAFEKRQTSKTVIAIGRLVKYKGFDVLIKAWHLLLQTKPNFYQYQLKIIGNGPEIKNLENLIKSYHLQHSIFLMGDLEEEEKNKILDESILFVAPSINRSETFGISILEAMGRALPVITTHIPTGVLMLARNGKCGAMVTPGSTQELAQALSDLLTNQIKLFRAGKENLEFVKNQHSKKTLISSYEHLIHDLYTDMIPKVDLETLQAA